MFKIYSVRDSTLPAKYLGVPLISSRLLNMDCKVLVEKARNRIGDWGFLWCNGDYKRGKSKVAWDDICLPKHKGGLGLRSLEVGNGRRASLWHDMWSYECPLSRYLTPRDINREGHNLHECVAGLIEDGTWRWPVTWLIKAPNLALIAAPNINNARQDTMRWCDLNGNLSDISVRCAWEVLRPRGQQITWYHIPWFSHWIPRHAFHIWLVMRRCLKTQDKLKPWDVDAHTDLMQLRCPLCGLQQDSHEHLFFECSFSSKVWKYVRNLAGMEIVPPVLDDIVQWFQPMANKRSFKNVVGKMIFAAASYFIWIERNNRIQLYGKGFANQCPGALGLWERVRVSCGGYLRGGLGLKLWGSGGLGFGGKWC
ncbi:reverse transcriptase domain, reverse transcriptase zinc-binding domain protein, partial [Tanacetum coccineum]